MKWLILFLVCLSTAYGSDNRTRVQPPIRVDMAPPPPPEDHIRNGSPERNVVLTTISMKVDNFDPLNDAQFQMRYMYNEEFFGGSGSPIFIMVGGEWTISSSWLQTGNMYEMAKENKGYMIYTEHRYYGQSMPVPNMSTLNMRFLNVDQALADLAHFIGFLRSQERFKDSKIILYGGSYAANMVIWFKQRYPNLVTGVVGSSGPIKGEVDFKAYLEVVHNAFLSEGGEECINVIRQGVADTVAAMETEAGRRTLEAAYRLCEPMDYNNTLDLAYFEAALITWTFSGAVQQATPGSLKTICNAFAGTTWGTTPMQKLGGFAAWRNGLPASSCWGLSYQGVINSYQIQSESRAWYYQTCTEYGYYQTAPTSGTVFDPLVLVDVAFYVDICQKIFDEKFDKDFLYAAVDRVNNVFGGLYPDANHTINIHGDIDPWHALGVIDRDIKEGSPTYLVPRASHCFDMRQWSSSDTIKMSQVQLRARRMVSEWLQ